MLALCPRRPEGVLLCLMLSGNAVVAQADDTYAQIVERGDACSGPLGDPNGDGAVNSTDALWIIQYEFGLRDGLELSTSDLNCDGLINSTDALWAIQVEFGMRGCPACAELPLFPAPATFGGSPEEFVLDHLDADDIVDLITLGYDDAVHTFHGVGDGTFAPHISYTIGDDPELMRYEDINGDGLPDILSANNVSEDISVLLAQPGGEFQPATAIEFRDETRYFDVVDVNGDDRPDIIASIWNWDEITVFLGDGDGVFSQEVTSACGIGPAAFSIRDLNGDSIPDMVVLNESGEDASVLIGAGDGSFTSTPMDLGSQRPSRLLVEDLDGDAILDVLVKTFLTDASWTDTVSFLKGNGDGTFEPPIVEEAAEFSTPFVYLDLDGDSRPEVIAGSWDAGSITIYPGGTGITSPQVTDVSQKIATLDVLDWNEDSILDLIAGTQDSEACIYWLQGVGDGTFLAPECVAQLYSLEDLAIEDLNNDGSLDFLSNAGQSIVARLGMPPDNTFLRDTHYVLPDRPDVLEAADIDEDNLIDILAVPRDQDEVWIFHGQEGGGFAAPLVLPTSFEASFLVVDDFDANGLADIAFANLSDDVTVLYQEENGSFTEAPPMLVGGTIFSLVSADFNQDGLPDLATTASLDSEVETILNQGGRTFSEPIESPTGLGVNFVDTGEFTGDAYPDLLISVVGTRAVSVLEGLGNGEFVESQRVDFVDQVALNLITTDLNADALDDAVVLFEDERQIVFLVQQVDYTFMEPVFYDISPAPWGVRVDDITGDGLQDVLVQHSQDAAFSILVGKAGNPYSIASQLQFAALGGPYGQLILDANDDGLLDIVYGTTDGFVVTLQND